MPPESIAVGADGSASFADTAQASEVAKSAMDNLERMRSQASGLMKAAEEKKHRLATAAHEAVERAGAAAAASKKKNATLTAQAGKKSKVGATKGGAAKAPKPGLPKHKA